MATEAQRLMVMSLGKIQGCRQQRGGINLHKSLLVTKVLYRARSVALSENAAPKAEEPSDDQCVPEISLPEDDHVDSIEQEDNGEWDNNNSTCSENKDLESDNYCDLQDKENVNPQYNSSKPQNYPVHSPEDFSEQYNKDQNIDRCSRCIKRRLTEVEEAVESISPKKQRIEESEHSTYETEPMQVETTQITSLVTRFSSGFTGLLASDTDNNTHISQETHDGHDSQGHSDSSLLSCSTQIKESFELLARPIALSV